MDEARPYGCSIDPGCPGPGFSGAEVAVALHSRRGGDCRAGGVGVSGPYAAIRGKSPADPGADRAAGSVCRQLSVA